MYVYIYREREIKKVLNLPYKRFGTCRITHDNSQNFADLCRRAGGMFVVGSTGLPAHQLHLLGMGFLFSPEALEILQVDFPTLNKEIGWLIRYQENL